LLRYHSSFSDDLAAAALGDAEGGDQVGDVPSEEAQTTTGAEAAAADPLVAEGLISLQDYVDRMQADQEVIYYVTGESREAIAKSPLLEAFRKRRLEVLYMAEPVDEWVINTLQDIDGKNFQAIDAEDVDLSDEDAKIEGAESTKDKERTIELVSFLKKELENRVADVRESQRLTDSPCVMVTPKGGVSQNLERLMRMNDQEFAPTKRILEINSRHATLVNMGELLRKDRESDQLKEWAQFLVDYVLLGEGSIEDPQRITATIQRMMTAASEHALPTKA